MRIVIFMVGMAVCGMASASKESDCQMHAENMERVAHAMENGMSEEKLLTVTDRTEAEMRAMTKEELRYHQRITRETHKMIRYVFAVKQSSKTARIDGYRKCMAGDFR